MTDQLIIQGLPLDVDELELHRFITQQEAGGALSSCNIIRRRETTSRGFGFLLFKDIEAARDFKEAWYRHGLVLHGHDLRIDYSRDSRDAGSWICEHASCRASNYARREVCYKCERPRETDFSKDTGTLPSQFLQLRDLQPETTPQQIVTAVTKLQDVQIRRILLVDGREGEHVPIAFCEFLDSNAAGRALALAAALPGKGFCIKGKPVRLCYIHVGVFVPVYGSVEPGVFKATNSNQLLAYWNQDYRCSVYIPDNAIPEDVNPAEDGQKTNKESGGENKRKRKALGSGVTIKSGSVGMIGHWSRQQDELNAARQPSPPKDTTMTDSFADLKMMACLLCSRKFKTAADLQAHESQSDLHRNNLANPTLLAKAQERLRARNVSTDAAHTSAPEYRDRALERRIQIKQSGGTIETPPPSSRKKTRLASSPPPSEEPTFKGPSKGAQLLSRMGYTSGGLGAQSQGRQEAIQAETYLPGVGLGAAGAKVDVKDAEARRGASTYKDFVESVKEHARSRFQQEQA